MTSLHRVKIWPYLQKGVCNTRWLFGRQSNSLYPFGIVITQGDIAVSRFRWRWNGSHKIMEPWRMDGDRMEFWFHNVELLIAPLALVTCGNLERNNHRYTITFSVIHEINTLRFYCVSVCVQHMGCLGGWTRLQWWATFEQYLNLKLGEECIYYYY